MMKTMTAQEVFDTAVGGVLKQGRPGRRKDGGGSFCSDDGLRCAMGQLLPVEAFDRHDPAARVIGSTFMRALREEGIDVDEHWQWGEGELTESALPPLASSLIEAHDAALRHSEGHSDSFPGPFLRRFAALAREIATKRSLATTVIDQWEAAHTAGTTWPN